MPHGGISPRGAVYEGATLAKVYALAASATGAIQPGVNTIQNSTAVAGASFALPTPVSGLEIDVFVTAYSTAGTDSLKVTAPTGVKINDGSTPLDDTINFGAAGQTVRLVGSSATRYLVLDASTGVTFST